MPSEAVSGDPEFEKEEKLLKELDYYHGFIPRDDLPFLIRKEGDYLLRVSEVDTHTDKIKRDIILSLMAETAIGSVESVGSVMGGVDDNNDNQPKPKRTRVRNVVVRRVQNKYTVEPDKVFDSIKELINFYQKSHAVLNKWRFILKSPVKLARWELRHSDIKLSEVLGHGEFGEVRRGTITWRGKPCDVAVKLTKGENDLGKEKIKEMMREARLMRNLKHRNIVRMYGVAVDEQPLYIVLELIRGGALNSYLEKNRGKVDTPEKMAMCLGAAHGVHFLHRQNIIHRDLAARNCLYTLTKITKITDFGLSRMGKEYKIKTAVKLPIKWLAPETITKFIFTDKTDVYSFGVMIHEIFADGTEPWEGMGNSDVKKAVCEGKVLPMKEVPEKIRAYCHEKVLCKDETTRDSMAQVMRFLDLLSQPDPAADQSDGKVSSGKSEEQTSEKEKTAGSRCEKPRERKSKSVAKSVAKSKESASSMSRSKPSMPQNTSNVKPPRPRTKRSRGFHNREKSSSITGKRN